MDNLITVQGAIVAGLPFIIGALKQAFAIPTRFIPLLVMALAVVLTMAAAYSLNSAADPITLAMSAIVAGMGAMGIRAGAKAAIEP